MPSRASIILIRESEEQLTGSGCCGRLEGDFAVCEDGTPLFAERREIMEGLGPLYRALRERYAHEAEIQVLDPRNVSLVFMLVRDFIAFRVGVGEALRTLARVPVQAVIVNGRLAAKGRWPSVEEVAARLEVDGATEAAEPSWVS